jgi:MSHA biogenesis protein MshO
MHQIHLKRFARGARGLTLIELVVAMVLVAIIVGATLYFAYPLRQAVDLTTRAELTDIADNALQRIAREVRSALPNSVRVDPLNPQFLELIPVRTAGRYRAEPSGAGCNATTDATGSDELAFDAVDSCFKSIGTLPDAGTITTSDFVVLNNYGPNFAGQDAYAVGGTLNRARIVGAVEQVTARERINYTATTFSRVLHDSPGKRFFIVNGNATSALPEPVTFDCSTPTLLRRWGYAMTLAQPTGTFTGGTPTSAVLATNVSQCSFEYLPNIAPQVGLLTLRLTLSKTVSGGGTETVSLYHAVHVSNLP